jgi:hypothetical protein
MSTITREQAQKIIEAADEVITALAGTNEDVHPESDNMLRLWDDLNDRYAPPEVVRELARIALASLELERGMIRRFDLDMSDCDSCGQDCGADMVEDLDGEYVLWDEVLPFLYRYDEYTAPPAPEVPDDIDARMKTAGMLSASEIIAGQPIDAFMKHAGVVDLESLIKWAEMRRAEFLRMQAQYELGDKPKDDMYEWVISHVAAFSELHVNIRAAMLQGANERHVVRSEHAEWSQSTFGDVGPVGPLKHLSKEALEAAAEPGDLSEWADMQFLLWDAQRRAGITDEQITLAMIKKLAVNKARTWPEPKDGEPRLHIKAEPQQEVEQ